MNRSGLRHPVVFGTAAALALLGLAALSPDAHAAATRYEAENAVISSGAVATNHLNYSGTGFVDTTNATGVYVEFAVNAATAGTANLVLRYANGTTADRPADVAVNGTTVSAARSFPATANWDTWANSTLSIPVKAGSNTVRLTATTANGLANLDYADLDAAPASADYQAEDAVITQGAVVTNHLGYTGTGFVDYTNVAGSSVEFTVAASSAGQAGLVFRYANGTTVDRPMDISVNGAVVASAVSFPATADWDTWTTKTVNANLNAGTNTIRATATTANGGPNLDKLTLGAPSAGDSGPAVPFGSHQFPYVTGTLKPSGAQSAIDQAVITKYNAWKSAFVKQNCGNGWYETLSPDADHPYVAEGQGYGMVVTATMAGADPNAKTVFDGMVKYVLAHPSVHNANLLAAEQDSSCKSVDGTDSATDGDMDVAYGLLLADKQWGSTGTYNYKDLAVRHINAIKSNEINSTTHLLLLGDWSTSGDQYYFISRSSDWMIDHFRAFKRATGDTAWDTIRTAHQNLITNQQATYASGTGLLADFVVNTNTTPKPAPGEVLESANDGDYGWNACRDPWRIGTDAVTSGDSASLASARKLNSWIKSKTGSNPDNIVTGYHLSGAAFDSGHDMAFTAPFVVTAMTDPGSQAWLDSLWNKLTGTAINSSLYYGGSVQLQSMIVASGNYWVP
ncbi:glycosyl hydrolase family 8 [Streptomyces sp. NBC_01465]|uniref:glycosyl hydrolase family 8 n=1 Tax=Streptomyces sp. NBC_01465 TaxID=2903878 RepID=UPI002E36EB76|nr:glycosyl hydrolase family 8 [Streptomyces sp. NBC_01465]